VALVVAKVVANGQVVLVAAAPFAARLDMFQCGGFGQHMFATYPARHDAVQLARYGFVDFQAGKGQGAH
jgi:hypothetical protein